MIRINKSKNGYRVQTVADNNEVLQTSEELETKQAVLTHISSMVQHIVFSSNLRAYPVVEIVVRCSFDFSDNRTMMLSNDDVKIIFPNGSKEDSLTINF